MENFGNDYYHHPEIASLALAMTGNSRSIRGLGNLTSCGSVLMIRFPLSVDGEGDYEGVT